jgi:hypothetical protein
MLSRGLPSASTPNFSSVSAASRIGTAAIPYPKLTCHADPDSISHPNSKSEMPRRSPASSRTREVIENAARASFAKRKKPRPRSADLTWKVLTERRNGNTVTPVNSSRLPRVSQNEKPRPGRAV